MRQPSWLKNWKIKIIFFLFILMTSMLCWRIFCLQVKNGEYYEVLALGQQVSFSEADGYRGGIFLKDGGLPLSQTNIKKVVRCLPQKMSASEMEQGTKVLAGILKESEEELFTLFREGKVVKREISDQQEKEIKTRNLGGVYLEQFLTRFYPQNSLASQVVGFVNEEGQGQYGIEGYYDSYLRAREGVLEEGKSPFGYLAMFFLENEEEPSQKGADIFLTLDYNIQYFAEKLLQEAKENWDIDSGQIIVQDPQTGKILALAELPGFNPNQYREEENLEIFRNASVQKLFEPGSVFKPITMAAGLEENLVTPETIYEDRGFVEVGGPPIYNFQKRVWGEQSMIDVLEESINTGAIFVQQKLGKELFLKYVEKFGFFEKTEIDLQGEEFSSNETLKNGYPRDVAVASFGQGVQITPLQLVRAFSAIANGGKLLKPYIVEKIITPGGEVQTTQPEVQKEALSETTAAKLTAMLVSVVRNGAGRRAKIPGYYIAGKTGTAQVPLRQGGYSETDTIQSFIGYFPALSPRALILVKLDNPKGVGSAGYCAVPLFQKLAKYIIDLWQIPPSEE